MRSTVVFMESLDITYRNISELTGIMNSDLLTDYNNKSDNLFQTINDNKNARHRYAENFEHGIKVYPIQGTAKDQIKKMNSFIKETQLMMLNDNAIRTKSTFSDCSKQSSQLSPTSNVQQPSSSSTSDAHRQSSVKRLCRSRSSNSRRQSRSSNAHREKRSSNAHHRSRSSNVHRQSRLSNAHRQSRSSNAHRTKRSSNARRRSRSSSRSSASRSSSRCSSSLSSLSRSVSRSSSLSSSSRAKCSSNAHRQSRSKHSSNARRHSRSKRSSNACCQSCSLSCTPLISKIMTRNASQDNNAIVVRQGNDETVASHNTPQGNVNIVVPYLTANTIEDIFDTVAEPMEILEPAMSSTLVESNIEIKQAMKSLAPIRNGATPNLNKTSTDHFITDAAIRYTETLSTNVLTYQMPIKAALREHARLCKLKKHKVLSCLLFYKINIFAIKFKRTSGCTYDLLFPSNSTTDDYTFADLNVVCCEAKIPDFDAIVVEERKQDVRAMTIIECTLAQRSDRRNLKNALSRVRTMFDCQFFDCIASTEFTESLQKTLFVFTWQRNKQLRVCKIVPRACALVAVENVSGNKITLDLKLLVERTLRRVATVQNKEHAHKFLLEKNNKISVLITFEDIIRSNMISKKDDFHFSLHGIQISSKFYVYKRSQDIPHAYYFMKLE